MTSVCLDPVRNIRLARNLQQTPTLSKLSPGYRRLTPISSTSGYMPWCRGEASASMSVVTTLRSGVYHLLRMRHVQVEVRIMLSASVCLLYFCLLHFCLLLMWRPVVRELVLWTYRFILQWKLVCEAKSRLVANGQEEWWAFVNTVMNVLVL